MNEGNEHHEKLTDSEYFAYSLVSMGLVITAGLMSGLSIGLMSLDKMNLRVLSRSGEPFEKKCARMILPVVENHHHLMVTLLLCNAAAMEALPIYLDKLVTSHAMAIIISVLCIFLFGEIIPQALCVRYSLAIGAYTSWLVTALKWVTFPVSWTLGLGLDHLLGTSHHTAYKRIELKELVNMHVVTNHGPLSVEECNVIASLLDMHSKTVKDRTILLENLFNVSIDEMFDESMAKKIAKDGHSKIPIYRETPKNIIGLLPVKKLIGISYGTPISQIPLVSTSGVPSNKPLSDLLSEFQIKGGNVRLVYEAETSTLIGMITLDDLMQEMKEEIHIESSKTTEADERSSRLKNRKETERDVRSDRKINIVIEPNTSKEVLDQRRPTLDWEF